MLSLLLFAPFGSGAASAPPFPPISSSSPMAENRAHWHCPAAGKGNLTSQIIPLGFLLLPDTHPLPR
jgi:hypothetical protein